MDDESELAPCPLCGANPVMHDDDDGETIYWINCPNCTMALGSRDNPFANPLHLAREWKLSVEWIKNYNGI